MRRDSLAIKLQDWAVQVDAAVQDLMPLHAPLNDLPGAPRHRRALKSLSIACLSNTQSVFYLVAGGRLWWAELVMRSVTEGTAKFGYLLEKRETYTARCLEYCDVLPRIGDMRRHERAAEALRVLQNDGERELQAYRDLLLTDEQLALLRSVYPREMRNSVQQRWGFTRLIDVVSQEGGAFGPTGRALLHGYSIASDLQHMSWEGAEMPHERDRRSEKRRTAIEPRAWC